MSEPKRKIRAEHIETFADLRAIFSRMDLQVSHDAANDMIAAGFLHLIGDEVERAVAEEADE